MKIVILDGHTENPGDLSWQGFEALGEVAVYERTPAEKIVERIGHAEIVISNKTPISEETLAACPAVYYVGVLATGYNVVDTAAAKRHGVTVTNIPTYGTNAVAQYVFALLLEVCHHVGAHSDAVHGGEWASSPDFSFWKYPLIELAGKTMGIVGYGRIGRAVARIARGFGMRVIACNKGETGGDKNASLVGLDALLGQSDVVSLNCPLTPETEGMINAEALAKMKPTAILLNTARGPLVDEAALAEALNGGTIYAAALDVVSVEPIRAHNPLLGAKNCLITPHIAWAPKESRQRLMDTAVENLAAFLRGQPQNVVNP